MASGEIIIYQTEDGQAKLDVRLEKETIWLDAHRMGRLFERDRSVIVKHIRNIYKTGELSPNSTCAKNAQVAADGKIRRMDVYNLDMIISVGYKVNSKRGTEFRIWATQVLKDHIVKGYTVNEKRLRDVDGNKRIAASLFLWFLDANGILYRNDGGKRIGDNALVALTLMIAESRPEEKDVIIKVVVNLINRKN
jgi:hypothetical protein